MTSSCVADIGPGYYENNKNTNTGNKGGFGVVGKPVQR